MRRLGDKPEAILRCISCGSTYPENYRGYLCGRCGDLLEVVLNPESVRVSVWQSFEGKGVWRYRALLPVDHSRRVSLSEGGTPLIRCERLAKWVGVRELYLKFEGANPSGSFKDRGMTVAVTKALELGAHGVICASTGNTAASLSAYAARAGVKAVTAIPERAIALGKLFQAIAHGAIVVKVRGNFDAALQMVMAAADRLNLYLLNSLNAWRLEGQKTLGYELAEELGGGYVVSVPVGNCGNIAAIWKGFSELRDLGLIDEPPRMIGVQAEGASPFADLVKKGGDVLRPVEKPETIATAIRIGKPVNWKKALKAVRESEGDVETVSDQEILEAQASVARLEGLGVEPASAASVAGIRKMVEDGRLDKSERVVCVCTGHLLKDPNPQLFKPIAMIETAPRTEDFIKEVQKLLKPG